MCRLTVWTGGGVRSRCLGVQSRPGVMILFFPFSLGGVVCFLGKEVWRGDLCFVWRGDSWRGGLEDAKGRAAASFGSPLTRFLSTCRVLGSGMLCPQSVCGSSRCLVSFCVAEAADVGVWDACLVLP